jgi:hypothetical protein
VYNGETELGTIQTRRVKGAFGSIEVVLGMDQEYRVQGVLFQRLREPAPTARALRDPAWLKALVGRNADEGWEERPQIPNSEIQTSVDAVTDGVRTMLRLSEIADERDTAAASRGKPHH